MTFASFLGRMAPSLYLTGKSVLVLSTVRECLGAMGLMALTTRGFTVSV